MNKSWIWITGSASGLGQHLTNALLAKGYKVLATDINLSNLVQSRIDLNWPVERVKIAALDITQASQWQQMYQEKINEGLVFSHLLNVAGFIEPHSGHDNTAQHVSKHLDINVMGIVNGCYTLLPHFKQQLGGHIINISSFAAIAPVPGVVSYSASKAAARSFSNGLAMELKLDDIPIDVTCVCPDLIATPMMDKQLSFGNNSRLVFSGKNALPVEYVAKVILGKVWQKKPIEVTLPPSRAWQIKLISLFPNFTLPLYRHLAKKGEKNLSQQRISE